MPILKRGKTNWKYILIVLILAVIVGGGILWCVKKQEVSLPEFPETKKPEKVVEDETADWETYRNEEYGFEIKYPKDWRGDFETMTFRSGTPESKSFLMFMIETGEGFRRYVGGAGKCTDREEFKISGITGIKVYCYYPKWKVKPDGEIELPFSLIDEHIIIGHLCADENFIPYDYNIEECETGIYNNYFWFELTCQGEEWLGETGRNRCSQLFNQLLSTFRFSPH